LPPRFVIGITGPHAWISVPLGGIDPSMWSTDPHEIEGRRHGRTRGPRRTTMGTIEGVIDRGVRITIGLVALVVGLASGLGTAVSTVLLVAAAIVFLTGVVGSARWTGSSVSAPARCAARSRRWPERPPARSRRSWLALRPIPQDVAHERERDAFARGRHPVRVLHRGR
jgi:hypothetical protein